MSKSPRQQTSNQIIDSSPSSGTPLHYLVGGLLVWLAGAMFMAGWHYSTLGNTSVVRSIVDGLAFVVLAALLLAAIRVAKLKVGGMGTWNALALAPIIVCGSFMFGGVVGYIWDGIGGHYPDKSELGNTLSTVVGVEAFTLTSW